VCPGEQRGESPGAGMTLPKIVAYGTLTNTDVQAFDRSVNEHLGKGWSLYGDSRAIGQATSTLFVQTLVQYEAEEVPVIPTSRQSRSIDMTEERPTSMSPGADDDAAAS